MVLKVLCWSTIFPYRCVAGLQGSTTISLVPLLLLVLFCVYLHKRGLGPTNITR